MQQPFTFALPQSAWRAPVVSQLPSWRDAKRVSFDFETCDPDLNDLGPGVRRKGCFVAGFSFHIEDGPAHYVPVAHQGGDNVADPQAAMQYLRDQFSGFTGVLTGAGLQYDLDWAMEYGCDISGFQIQDIQVAEPLIDDLQMKYGLEAIAQRRGLPGKDETLLRAAATAYGCHPKKELWKLPARYVGGYAEQDARLPNQILRRQEKDIDATDQWGNNLWDIWRLESAVLPVLLKMRRRGVRVDLDRVQQIQRWAVGVVDEEFAKLRHMTGVQVYPSDVNKAAALEPVFTSIGVKLPRTKTNKPSITKAVMQAVKHPVGDALRRAREFHKLANDFCGSVLKHQINGRIHCTFNQLRKTKDEDQDVEDDEDGEGARYGRVSCVDPNLQQQPIRNKEYGKKWRSVYIAEDGGEWLKGDFSQQEPRQATHFSELMGLTGAAEFAEQYRTNPKMDFHDRTSSITGLERGDAKNTGLGIMYGMGGGKLADALGLPTVMKTNARTGHTYRAAGPEAQKVMDTFNEGVPFLKQLAQLCQNAVKRKGYIRTLLGRHCRFPRDEHGNYDWLHKALNRLIQGSSADQTKKVLVEADRAGFPLQLQVHDEIDFTIRSRREGRDFVVVMRDAVKLRVPVRVDAEVGPSWGEAVKVDVFEAA